MSFGLESRFGSLPAFQNLHEEMQRENQRVLDMGGPTTTQLQTQRIPNSDQVSKKLGDGMLMGWCLLGEHCPLCNTPLMRKKDSTMWCVHCELPVMKEEDLDPTIHTQVNNSTTAETRTGATDDAYDGYDDDNMDFSDFIEVEKVENDRVATASARTNDVSAKLGQYMLQGWTLLDRYCDDCNCPLVGKQGELLCVACGVDKNDPKEDQDKNTAPTATAAAVPTDTAAAKPTSPTTVTTFQCSSKPKIRISRYDQDEEDEEEDDKEEDLHSDVEKKWFEHAEKKVLNEWQKEQEVVGTSANDDVAGAIEDASNALIRQLRLSTQVLDNTHSHHAATQIQSVVNALTAIKVYKSTQ